jgi:hypothetical protein
MACLLALCSVTHTASAQAQGPLSRQIELQSALIYKIINFVEWDFFGKDSAPGELVICVLNAQAIEGALLRHRTATWRKLSIRVNTISSTALISASNCQAVVFGDSSPRQFLSAPQKNVLTIGFGDQFVREGGILGLVVRSNKLSFDINLQAAHAAGIRIEAPLVQLAHTVVLNK